MNKLISILLLVTATVAASAQIGITGNAAFVGAAGFSVAAASGTSPAYVGTAGARIWAGAGASDTVSISNNISAGNTAVLTASWEPGGASPGMGLSAVADSQGNTWTVQVESANTGQYFASGIASSKLATGLTTSDSLTLTWTNGANVAKTALVTIFSGLAGTVDATATFANTFSDAWVMSASASYQPDVAVAAAATANTGTFTPTDSSFNLVSAQNNGDGKIFRTLYKITNATGSVNGGGTNGTTGTAHGELLLLRN